MKISMSCIVVKVSYSLTRAICEAVTTFNNLRIAKREKHTSRDTCSGQFLGLALRKVLQGNDCVFKYEILVDWERL